jgi:hypothetical protein
MNSRYVEHEHQVQSNRTPLTFVVPMTVMISGMLAVLVTNLVLDPGHFADKVSGLIFASLVVNSVVALVTTGIAQSLHLQDRRAAVRASGTVLGTYIAVMLLISLALSEFVLAWNDLIYMSVPAIAVFFVVNNYQYKEFLQRNK